VEAYDFGGLAFRLQQVRAASHLFGAYLTVAIQEISGNIVATNRGVAGQRPDGTVFGEIFFDGLRADSERNLVTANSKHLK